MPEHLIGKKTPSTFDVKQNVAVLHKYYPDKDWVAVTARGGLFMAVERSGGVEFPVTSVDALMAIKGPLISDAPTQIAIEVLGKDMYFSKDKFAYIHSAETIIIGRRSSFKNKKHFPLELLPD